jgi:Flp pilus assembly protein TadG
MLGASMIRHIREAASRFVSARDGNVAVIFTIALVPLISFLGAAIDYSRANRARTAMQSAMDSTALMLSKDLTSGKITADQVDAKAKAYFAALYTNTEAVLTTPITATYTQDNGNLGSTIQVNGSGAITTDFMKVAGFPTLGFNGTSTTAWGNVKMRVALALDNTGSMKDDGKIGALRTAASNLVDQLSALAKNDGDVLISVIPFAKTVNAGSSNYGANWIDWTDWLNPPTAQPNNGSTQATLPINWHGIGPGMKCPFTNGSGGFTCTTGPTSTSNTSTIPSSGTYSGYICPSVDANSHTRYNGCWDSELVNDATPQVFCTGSQCTCPSGAPTTGSKACSCSTTHGVTTCTGPRYIHNWTQPAPSDTADNTNQPHLNVQVGFNTNDTAGHVPSATNPNPNPAWIGVGSTPTICSSPSALNCMTAVANNWKQPSTNPISTWSGCITDRSQDYDTTSDAPVSGNVATLFPANQYYSNSEAYCAHNNSPPLLPVMPLTSTWSTLKTNINAMQPTGSTNQAVGLAWAWQSLLQTGPIPAPAEDSNFTYNRVIILLSDGLNTEDRWPAYGDGSTQDSAGDIDARQALLCQNIKNPIDPKTNKPMYTIYTIQVNTNKPADPTSTVLKNCATDPDKFFFMLTNANQIVTTFNSIGTSLSQLRVAR